MERLDVLKTSIFDETMAKGKETAETLKMASIKMRVMIELLEKEKKTMLENGESEEVIDARLMLQWKKLMYLIQEYFKDLKRHVLEGG